MSIKKSTYSNLNFLDKLKSQPCIDKIDKQDKNLNNNNIKYTSTSSNHSNNQNSQNNNHNPTQSGDQVGLLGKTLKTTINEKIAYYKSISDKKALTDLVKQVQGGDLGLGLSNYNSHNNTRDNNKIDIKISVNYPSSTINTINTINNNTINNNTKDKTVSPINKVDHRGKSANQSQTNMSSSINKSNISNTNTTNNNSSSVSKNQNKILNLKHYHNDSEHLIKAMTYSNNNNSNNDKMKKKQVSNNNSIYNSKSNDISNSNDYSKVIRTKSSDGFVQNNLNISLLATNYDNKPKNENSNLMTNIEHYKNNFLSKKNSPLKTDNSNIVSSNVSNLNINNTSFGYNPITTDYGQGNNGQGNGHMHTSGNNNITTTGNNFKSTGMSGMSKVDIHSSDYLETYQSTAPNYLITEKDSKESIISPSEATSNSAVSSTIKKKLYELETKIEKLLQKTNYKVFESDDDRLSSLGKKFVVIILYLLFILTFIIVIEEILWRY